MPEPELVTVHRPVTVNQAVRIASRLIAVYLLWWALDNATYIPQRVLSLMHYMRETDSGASVLSTKTASFGIRSYILDICGIVIRTCVFFFGAGWFYRCGPRIQSFLLPPERVEAIPSDTQSG
jgi:hypothetical protein